MSLVIRILIWYIDSMKITSLSTCKKYTLTLNLICRKSGINTEAKLRTALLFAIGQKSESEKNALMAQYKNNEILRLCQYFGIVRDMRVLKYTPVEKTK